MIKTPRIKFSLSGMIELLKNKLTIKITLDSLGSSYLNPASSYGVLFGCLSNFFFAFCSRLLFFCF